MTTSQFSPLGGLQQCILEWQVEGRFDGTTIAGGVTVEENLITQGPSAFGEPFVIEEDGNVGIFNVDGSGGNSASADRYIQWIRLELAGITFPVTGLGIFIVDVSSDVPSTGPFRILETIQYENRAIGGAIYDAKMRLVPQGGALRISGLTPPPPGEIHRVTVGVRNAGTPKEDAELEQASCCLFETVILGGFTTGP